VASTSPRRQLVFCEPLSAPVTHLDPELDVAALAMVGEQAQFVLVGGFAVIANRFVRATEDIDFLAPDDEENDRRIIAALQGLDGVRERDEVPLVEEHLIGQAHLRSRTSAGIVDILRGRLPPLDYETVAERAIPAEYGGVMIQVASLRSIVGFKRLADRARDRNDLIGLEEVHGSLPIDPLPSVDLDT
jgi:nucleotidyltransferase AbiEii toxin of type IV toxin-antitoxin system